MTKAIIAVLSTVLVLTLASCSNKTEGENVTNVTSGADTTSAASESTTKSVREEITSVVDDVSEGISEFFSDNSETTVK